MTDRPNYKAKLVSTIQIIILVLALFNGRIPTMTALVCGPQAFHHIYTRYNESLRCGSKEGETFVKNKPDS